MSLLKKIFTKNKHIFKIVYPVYFEYKSLLIFFKTRKALSEIKYPGNTIFYIGIPVHKNLGDLAQGVCIRRWLKKNYPNKQVVEIETNALVNTRHSLLNKLKKVYKQGDIIVYQSGYTTTDIGGFADEMHRAVMDILPNAKMLMLPQTIFFVKQENQIRTSKCYNSMKKMLFLARDRVSYNLALEMFPDIPVMQFPDIVTTMIGKYTFNYERNGILFCCRNDSEKYYSNSEIDDFIKKCSTLSKTDKTDTTKSGKTKEIVNNAEAYINKEIDLYAHYKLIITDRYHGTILSLVAGTPVIIIKTTDHKVTTGAEWFKGVYDDYVYLAESLEHSYEIAKTVLNKKFDYALPPYFESNYYDKLPEMFEKSVE
ncbi:MAG: hypothetical protein GX273_04695 [Bacteroidales bacterium]|nr:hypothetical protein [Bacteroidales bacterium]